MPENALQLQILNLIKHFLVIGHDRSSAAQNIKAINTRKGQNAITIRRKAYLIGFLAKIRVFAAFFVSHVGK